MCDKIYFCKWFKNKQLLGFISNNSKIYLVLYKCLINNLFILYICSIICENEKQMVKNYRFKENIFNIIYHQYSRVT